jgi:hypothetical protein
MALANKEISHLRVDNDRLQSNIAELKVEMAGVEKEREFYFDKLRDIEMMLQDLEDSGKGNELTASIFEILYATADGFQPADDERGPDAEAEVEAEGVLEQSTDDVLLEQDDNADGETF